MAAMATSPEWNEGWSRAERGVTYGFVALGVALRVVQFAASPAQWLDEAMLSTSIVHLDLVQLLTKPLLYGQSAPPGYLLLVWLLVHGFGNADWVLRLVPFVASLVALLGSVVLSREILRGIARPVAVGLVATAAPLILFAGQAKQYSTDIAITVVVLFLASLAQRPTRSRSLVVALAACAAAPWFSLPAAITLGGAALALAFSTIREAPGPRAWRPLLRLAPLAALWGVSSLGALRFGRSHVAADQLGGLYEYWAAAFMPLPPPWSATLSWPVRALSRVFQGTEFAGLYYPARALFVLLMAVGSLSLLRRSSRVAVVLLAPVALALLGGMARLYPFADRLVLFLVPNLLLCVAEGVRAVGWWLAKLWKPAAPLWAAACCLLAAFPSLGSLPPYATEDIKPLLAYLTLHRKAGEPLYVFCDTLPAFELYVERGEASNEFIRGASHREDRREYFKELDQLRGAARAWVLVSHAVPTYSELESIRGYLDTIGVRSEEQIVPARKPANATNWALSAHLFRYDLSNPERARGASAATFMR